jgi:hypothetical protein
VKVKNWPGTLLPGLQKRPSHQFRRYLRRYRPLVELLEVRLTPSGVVLQTPIPLTPGQTVQGAGYSAALFSTGTGNITSPTTGFQNITTGQGSPILTNTDDAFVQVPLGFNFTFFGVQYQSVFVTSNGLLSFSELPSDTGYTDYAGSDLTTNVGPNRPLIAPLWDDWIVSNPGNVYYATLGNAGNREFIAEWNQVTGYPTSPNTVTFEVALFENDNHIEFRYQNVVAGNFLTPDVHDNGENATIGIRSGFPGATTTTQFATGGFNLPNGVGGIQIANDGGPSHLPVVNSGDTIVFTPNVPPTALALSVNTVGENMPVGTVVGNFTTTDADNPNDAFTYSLVSGSAPNDNALFTIVGNQLETNSVFTAGPRSQYTVEVQTTNLGGETFEQPFTINVTHVNQPPVIAAGQMFSVTQGTPVGAVIGTVSANDPNIFQKPPAALTYSTTSTVFAIDPNTGQLSVADPAAIDSTTAPSIAVPITVTDNGNPPLSTSGTVTVNVVQVPLTASITGAPTTVAEGTPINLSSVVSDASDQTVFRSWSVTLNGVPVPNNILSGGFIDKPLTGPTFSFTPTSAGDYVVTLFASDQRGQSVTANAAITVTEVPPVLDVGTTDTITSTAKAFSRTISFSSPSAALSVFVSYGDGTDESFSLLDSLPFRSANVEAFPTPNDHNIDLVAKTFTLQHQYTTAATFTVTVTITDASGGSDTQFFPVAVFDPAEFARVIAFAIGVADASGTANVKVGSPDGTIQLSASMVNALIGDSIGLTIFDGDPETNILDTPGHPSDLIPIDAGGSNVDPATPLVFMDTRAVTESDAVVNQTFGIIVPNSLLTGPLELLWYNKDRNLWEHVTSQNPANGDFAITPISDSTGRPTGFSFVALGETFGTQSKPNLGELSGTVFSIAVPVGNGGTSTTIVFPALLASNSNTGVSVLTTGFGSGSNLTLSLQESQSGLLLAGLVGAHNPGDAPGEVDNGVSADGEDQILNWLINGEIWRGRRMQRQAPNPPPANNGQQPQPPAPQQPGTVPPPGNQGVNAPSPSEQQVDHVPQPAGEAHLIEVITQPGLIAEPVVDTSDSAPRLPIAAYLAGGVVLRSARPRRRLGFSVLRDSGA